MADDLPAGASGFQIATGYVQVDPDAEDFQEKLEAAIGDSNYVVTIPVQPDTGDFKAQVDAAVAESDAVVTIPVRPEPGDFKAQVDALATDSGAVATVPVEPDAAGFAGKVEAAVGESDAAVTVPVEPNAAGFAEKVEAETKETGDVVTVPVVPDTAGFAEKTEAEAAVAGDASGATFGEKFANVAAGAPLFAGAAETAERDAAVAGEDSAEGFGSKFSALLGGMGSMFSGFIPAASADGAEAGEDAGKSFSEKFAAILGGADLMEYLIPAALIAVPAILATKFQSAMTMIETQAGVAKSALAGLSSGVLSLAGQVGFTPDSLAQALFHVESTFESTGITGSKALELLKTAAEGARVGGANLVDVTNALDAVIVSGVGGVKNYSQAMGALNAIVGAGDMTMSDLAKAMGSGIMAVAKSYGQSIQQVGAALDVFGDNNIRGAKAATDLRMAMQAILDPISTGAAALQHLGLTTSQLGDTMEHHGLSAAIGEFIAHLKASHVPISDWGEYVTDIFGKKAGVGIGVLIDQFGRLQSKFPAINKGASDFGNAWAATRATTGQQLHELESTFVALGVRIGTAILPVLSHILGDINEGVRFAEKWGAALWKVAGPPIKALYDGINKISDLFSGFLGKLGGDIFSSLSSSAKRAGGARGILKDLFGDANDVIRPVEKAFDTIKSFITSSFDSWWKSHGQEVVDVWHAVWTAARDTFKTAWDVIHAVVKAVWPAIQQVLSVGMAFVEMVWKNGWDALAAALKIVWAGIQATIKIAWDVIVGIISIALDLLTGHWSKAWDDLKTMVTQVWNAISQFLQTSLSAIGTMFTQIFGHVGSFLKTLWDTITSDAESTWNTISSFLSGILSKIGGFFTSSWEAISDGIKDAWGAISTFFTTWWNTLYSFVSGVIGKLTSFLTSSWSAISGAIQSAWNAIWSWFQSWWNTLYSWVSDLIGKLISFFASSWDTITNALKDAWNAIWSWFQGWWNTLYSGISAIVSKLISFLKSGWDTISSDVKTAWDAIWSWLSNFWTNTLVGGIKNSLAALRKDISGAWTDIESDAKTGWSDIMKAISTPIGWLINTAYDKGIARLWNDTVGKVGGPSMPQVTFTAFSKGGRVGGTGSGDVVPALLEPGETVVSRAHSAVLGPAFAAAGVPGYKAGGVVGGIGSSIGGWLGDVWHDITSVLGKSFDIAKMMADAIDGDYTALDKALTSFLGSAPGQADMPSLVEHTGTTIVKDIVKSLANDILGISAGGGGGGKSGDGTIPGGLGHVSATMAQIEDWWMGAGGPGGGTAHVAAAITGAESSFNVKAVQQGQPYSSTGWGLWQITPGDSEPQAGVNQQLLTGPTNAIAAVAKYRQAGGSFDPWTTYVDGAYEAFMDQGGWLQPGTTVVHNNTGFPERVSPPGGGAGGVTVIFNGTQYPTPEQIAALKMELATAVGVAG